MLFFPGRRITLKLPDCFILLLLMLFLFDFIFIIFFVLTNCVKRFFTHDSLVLRVYASSNGNVFLYKQAISCPYHFRQTVPLKPKTNLPILTLTSLYYLLYYCRNRSILVSCFRNPPASEHDE